MDSSQGFFAFSATDLDGKEVHMDQYIGKCFLIVNTASKDAGKNELGKLQKIYEKYSDKGLEIFAFPCRQFLKREHKECEKIKRTYFIKNKITFPVFSLTKVNGEKAHPMFKWLKRQAKGPRGAAIDWNYTKFFIKDDGLSVTRFSSTEKYEHICKVIEENLPNHQDSLEEDIQNNEETINDYTKCIEENDKTNSDEKEVEIENEKTEYIEGDSHNEEYKIEK